MVEIHVPFSLEFESEIPTRTQVRNIVDVAERAVRHLGSSLTGAALLVVQLPGVTEGAALVLAEMVGLSGELPRMVSRRRRADGTYGVADREAIIDLNKVRLDARGRR